MKKYYIRHMSVLLFTVLLFCCGCSETKATTMRLVKTEGTVKIADAKEKSINPTENLLLYSGYGMGTKSASYAWIDLDSTKLAKMDEESEIEIQKSGKSLDILINSGSMFFNVTEPLAEDESMDIRMSTMTVGIRGTCGWVSVPEENCAKVYILEGTVAVTAANTNEAGSVSGGNMAEITLNEAGETELTIRQFTQSEIPEFVMVELKEDESLSTEILDSSGIDINTENREQKEVSDKKIEDFLGVYTDGEHGYRFGLNERGELICQSEMMIDEVTGERIIPTPVELLGTYSINGNVLRAESLSFATIILNEDRSITWNNRIFKRSDDDRFIFQEL